MERKEILELRKKLKEELDKVPEESYVQLRNINFYNKDLLFDYDKENEAYYFALEPAYLKKIDFSNFSEEYFDSFYAKGFDFGVLNNVTISCPKIIYNKNYSNCKLKGVTFQDPFNNREKIEGTNFSGSIGVKIEPTWLWSIGVTYKGYHTNVVSFNNCNFKDATFLSDIKGMRPGFLCNYFMLNNTSFEGSHNAIIHLDSVFTYDNCNFSDAILYQTKPIHRDLNGVTFKNTMSYKSKTERLIDMEKRVLIDPKDCVFENCVFDNVAFIDDLENSKFINCELTNCINLKHYHGERYLKEENYRFLDLDIEIETNEGLKKARKKLKEELDKIPEGTYVSIKTDRLGRLLLDSKKERDTEKKSFHFAIEPKYLRKIDFTWAHEDFFDAFDARGFDFSILHNAILNEEKEFYDNDITNANLKGLTIEDVLHYYIIEGANFSGSKDVKIYPRSLGYKPGIFNGKEVSIRSLKNCNFNSAIFVGHKKHPNDFTKGYNDYREQDIYYVLDGASFEGSRYAVIHSDAVISYNNCNFKDAIIYQEQPIHRDLIGVKFKGALAIYSKFDRRVNRTSKILVDPVGCTFTDCDFDGVAFVDDPEKGKFINCNLDNIEVLKHYNGERTKKEIVFYTLDGKEVNTSSIIENYVEKDSGEKQGFIDDQTLIALEEKQNSMKKREEIIRKTIKDNLDRIEENNNIIRQNNNLIEQLQLENKQEYGTVSIPEDQFLVQEGDHYAINPLIIERGGVSCLNLSGIDFTNVRVGGYEIILDYRNTGAKIHPQKVYNKDISNCIFDRGNIPFYDRLEGVNLEGTNLDDCDFNIEEHKKISRGI